MGGLPVDVAARSLGDRGACVAIARVQPVLLDTTIRRDQWPHDHRR
jgi:hypothetical protein